MGIWEKLGDRPSEWCHPMVIEEKPDGGVRLCCDLKKLNDQVQRPVYPMRCPRDAIAELPVGAKYFTTLDASRGYWQMELAEDCRDLTTMMTPWGRVRHARGPMGFSASGDCYNERGDRALAGLEDVIKMVDDIMTGGLSFPNHCQKVWQILERCRQFG